MTTRSVPQMIRVYGAFVGAIHEAYGARPFTLSCLRACGIKTPIGTHWSKFVTRGVVVPATRDHKAKVTVWKLAPAVVEHFAAPAERA